MTTERIWPDVAVPPGEFLAETLEAMGISQADLARKAGRPVQAINEIIQGKKEITPETALQFERVLGTPAHVWVGLEADYRYVKARLEDRERLLKEEVPLAQEYPYGEMAQHDWVPKASDSIARAQHLLRFFGVGSLRNVPELPVAWRRSRFGEKSSHALAAWLRRGEIEAHAVETGQFDAAGIVDMLPVLRGFTRDGVGVLQKLQKILAERGVAVVFTRELRKTGVNGASRWIANKAVLQLTIFRRRADILWFTIFHELGHLLLHGRRGFFIEFTHPTDGPQENEANRFAMDHLIPPATYERFLSTATFTRAAIVAFADDLGVAPYVVLGRLQREGHVQPSFFNNLHVRLRWAEE